MLHLRVGKFIIVFFVARVKHEDLLWCRPLVRLKLLQHSQLLLFSFFFLALLLFKFELQNLHRIRTVNFLDVSVVTFNERVHLFALLLLEHLVDLRVQEVEDRRVLALDGALQFHLGLEVLQV